jgi:hypothetical protein
VIVTDNDVPPGSDPVAAYVGAPISNVESATTDAVITTIDLRGRRPHFDIHAPQAPAGITQMLCPRLGNLSSRSSPALVASDETNGGCESDPDPAVTRERFCVDLLPEVPHQPISN